MALGPVHATTARGPAFEPSLVVLELPEGRLGDGTRALQFLSCAALRRSDTSEGGGDEETRTPDPLLAKEMLCQLSYVPMSWKGGGRFWTRTRDLCLIRAVL
jgi:hypothetical protein